MDRMHDTRPDLNRYRLYLSRALTSGALAAAVAPLAAVVLMRADAAASAALLPFPLLIAGVAFAAFGLGLATADVVAARAERRIADLERESESFRKRAMRASKRAGRFKESTAQIQDAIDSIPDQFMLWDENDRLVLWNSHADALHAPQGITLRAGLPFEKYVQMTHPHLHPDHAGDEQSWVARRTAWHRDAAGEHEIQLASGDWVLLTERPTDDGGIVAIYTDITQRKRAQEALTQSERRFAHAQRLAHVGTWEWDAESNRIYWSAVMYDIVGLPRDSAPLDFEQYILLVHPANRDLARSTHRRLMKNGGQYNQEYQIIRPDGEHRTLRTEAEAILDHQGRPIRVVGAVHDLTELKRVERALRRAKESADKANAAKSEFLANVSHELRTPLNAIIGFSEVMVQEVFGSLGSERYREYAGDIQQSGTHLLGVINDLLDYSKLEAGHLELHPESVAVGDVIEKSVRLMRERATAENVSLRVETADQLPFIEADERKITQILLNLLSNAIKFTPEGGTVTVHGDTDGDGVEIVVRDTGQGMTEAEIALALSPFGQVDSTANRRHTGTGLGLPLSRSLAELHGGRLDVTSSPGAGTTVRVWLPTACMGSGDATRPRPPLQLVMGG